MTYVIAIDPGHGGDNLGTVHGALVEKHETQNISNVLFQQLAALGPFCPVLLRECDEQLSQRQRGALSAKYDADLVVSVHINAHRFERLHGFEAYHWHSNDLTKWFSRVMVECSPIQLRTDRVVSVGPDDYRTDADDWLENPRSILAAHRAPVVLVECGYASNEVDRAYLLTKPGQAAVANAITAGVIRLWDHQQKEATQ